MNENKEVGTEVLKKASASQRFVDMVMREFTTSSGELDITPYQRSLIQGYFVGCDKALRYLEDKRQKDAQGNDKYAVAAQKKLPYTWDNVNIGADLAQSIATFAKSNLSMSVRNHLFPVPYLNGKNGKYDLTFQEGYEGLKYKAIKYSLFPIVDIEADLLYAKDKFKMIKDCYNGASYELEITDPFDRGDIKGGYAYARFEDPRQNKLIVMTKAEIDEIRSKAKSQSFWKDWYKEMALKTIVRKISKAVQLDPKKFDDYYFLMEKMNDDAAERELAQELRQNANRETINVTPVAPEPAYIPERTQPVQQPAPKMVTPEPEPVPQPVAEKAEQQPLMGAEIPKEEILDF